MFVGPSVHQEGPILRSSCRGPSYTTPAFLAKDCCHMNLVFLSKRQKSEKLFQ